MESNVSNVSKFEFGQVSRDAVIKTLALAALVAVLLTLTYVGNANTLIYALVFALGGLLGLTEILGRYTDSPTATFKSPGAFFYVLVNACASALGLFLLTRLAPDVVNPITQVLLAWFGAMAFLRSSVFRARVGNEEVAIGPAVILDTLLKYADVQVERERAVDRATRVADVLQSLPLAQAGADLPRLCFALTHDLPTEIRQRVLDEITLIVTDTKRSETVKVMEIGLVLWNGVGIGTLTGAVDLLRVNLPAAVPAEFSASPAITIVPPAPQGKPQDLLPEIQRQLSQDRKLAKA